MNNNDRHFPHRSTKKYSETETFLVDDRGATGLKHRWGSSTEIGGNGIWNAASRMLATRCGGRRSPASFAVLLILQGSLVR